MRSDTICRKVKLDTCPISHPCFFCSLSGYTPSKKPRQIWISHDAKLNELYLLVQIQSAIFMPAEHKMGGEKWLKVVRTLTDSRLRRSIPFQPPSTSHPHSAIPSIQRTDFFFLKHDSSIFRQSSNSVCGSWMCQANTEPNIFHDGETIYRVG